MNGYKCLGFLWEVLMNTLHWELLPLDFIAGPISQGSHLVHYSVSQLWGVGWWWWCTECWGHVSPSGVFCRLHTPWGSRVGLLVESMSWLVGCVSCWVLCTGCWQPSLFLAPSCPQMLQMCWSPSVFLVGREKVGLLGIVPQAVEIGHSFFPYFPLREKSRAKEVSLGTELCHTEGRVMWIKWNCSSYPLQCICSDVLLHHGAETSPLAS